MKKDNYNKSNKRVLLNNQYKNISYNNKGRPFIKYGGTYSELDEKFNKIKDEEILSCFVHSDEYVYRFAFKIMYNTIKKAKQIGMDKDYIISTISEKAYGTNLLKPGFTIEKAKEIYDLVKIEYDTESDENKLLEELEKVSEKKYFHQFMGSFYNFTINPTFILGVIERDSDLEETVMNRIKKLFCLPEEVTWKKIKILLSENPNNRLYLDVLVYGSKCPESLYRRNMFNSPYIRQNSSAMHITEPTKCHESMRNNHITNIITSNTFYSVDNDMFFAKLLKSFDRKYMAGPSSSAVLAYIFVFTFLKLDESEENKILLLSCIIGDYIPYFHSLTEILMTYTFEIDKKYDLSIDPVDFTKELIKPHLSVLKNQSENGGKVGGKNKTKIKRKAKNI